MHLTLSTAAIALGALVGTAVGESHTVIFQNFCGYGTPLLIQGNNVLSRGFEYHSDGPLVSAIAYLQTGNCNFNGENCTLLETTLLNFAPGNAGSLTGINLRPPHQFSVPTGFNYFSGCDGAGSNCLDPDCPATSSPVSCQEDNINLIIKFCSIL
ncbi:hypothetical protein GSI_05567 [Ganoderma sinense ZZ0214-1]|uniref:Glycopeptide n=1 Tax=Ganoderma sinense ZZ0214-1 TaxID=1077348 RepID=A0A2G8SEZ6_9APHY|nr:hypothetical protein GSI_05567 [Ganoderma sinense ZZ0214-1]